MAQIGGDELDRLLEDGMNRAEKRKAESSERSRKSRDRDRRSPRRRSRSRSPARKRRNDEEDRLKKEQEEIERDRRTVFACQIHPRVDERDIFEFFSQCGKVRDVQLIRDSYTSKSKGLAYIEFHDQASVANALAFSGQLLGGYPISVQVTQSEKNRAAAAAAAAATQDGSMTLFITGMAKDVDEEELEPIFQAFGDLNKLEIRREPDPQGNRTGVVEFARGSEALEALQNLNGLTILGATMTLSQVDITGFSGGSGGGGGGGGAPTAEIPGLSSTALDEGHGGMQMTANSRLMLMQRLQASGGAKSTIAQNPTAPVPVNPMAALVTQMPAPLQTQFVQLKNMFDPTKESGRNWDREIHEDVKAECEKFGRVTHCAVDKNSLGHVYVKFDSPASALRAVSALNGRWFAQKQIQAACIAQQLYEQRYPDSTK